MVSPVRMLISVICLSVAAFSVFGFLASFESGVGTDWKIAYAAVGISSLGLSLLPWIFGREK